MNANAANGSQRQSRLKWLSAMVGIFCVGLAAIFVFASIAPSDFPVDKVVVVPSGASLTSVADTLAADGIVRSSVMFKVYVRLMGGTGVKAGQYLFAVPQSALRVAYRATRGDEGFSKIKVTIPEGLTSKDVSAIIGKAVPGFASTSFAVLAKSHEGYLFPDTYFFYLNVSPAQAIAEMNANFDANIATIATATRAFAKPMSDVIKMASIVEKEATSTADRRIIAGILWKRIADAYPLQVDPPFFYYLGKGSAQLTTADLATDSPYNLYRHTGLPPTPIDNPGLDAILATVTPIQSSYWYYLSDAKGNIHYAATYEQHLVNKDKWIK